MYAQAGGATRAMQGRPGMAPGMLPGMAPGMQAMPGSARAPVSAGYPGMQANMAQMPGSARAPLSQPNMPGSQANIPAVPQAPTAQRAGVAAAPGGMTLEQALQRLQAESEARKAAEARVRELEAQVDQLKKRAGDLQNGKPGARRAANKQRGASPVRGDIGSARAGDDPIDAAICEYLERNPDFPVLIQKVAPNYYVFGERGTIYVTQRGDHIVVRVGGGFKSLQVFMDERALMSSGIAAL